jgi:hypothetical protein
VIGNQANLSGGGIYLEPALNINSTMSIVNTEFVGNFSGWSGGGLHGRAELVSVTFAGNLSDGPGDGVAAFDGPEMLMREVVAWPDDISVLPVVLDHTCTPAPQFYVGIGEVILTEDPFAPSNLDFDAYTEFLRAGSLRVPRADCLHARGNRPYSAFGLPAAKSVQAASGIKAQHGEGRTRHQPQPKVDRVLGAGDLQPKAGADRRSSLELVPLKHPALVGIEVHAAERERAWIHRRHPLDRQREHQPRALGLKPKRRREVPTRAWNAERRGAQHGRRLVGLTRACLGCHEPTRQRSGRSHEPTGTTGDPTGDALASSWVIAAGARLRHGLNYVSIVLNSRSIEKAVTSPDPIKLRYHANIVRGTTPHARSVQHIVLSSIQTRQLCARTDDRLSSAPCGASTSSSPSRWSPRPARTRAPPNRRPPMMISQR